MSSSTLARHIGGLIHTGGARFTLPSDSLFILALTMPQLLWLRCDVLPSSTRKMILPANLRTLELNLSALDAATINAALEGIGRLTTLQSLTMELPEWIAEVSFVPLSKCASLEELTIQELPEVDWAKQPTDAQIDQFRALQELRAVSIHRLSAASLTRLLRVPHSLQWTEMDGLSNVRSKAAAALRNLPALLSIDVWGCRAVSFLPALTELFTLKLQIEQDPWAVTGDDVVEAISNCRQLTTLELKAPVTSAHLTLLFPQLTRLHELTLLLCSELESLSFLSAVPSLSQTLRVFKLDKCWHPDLLSVEMRHVLTQAAYRTPFVGVVRGAAGWPDATFPHTAVKVAAKALIICVQSS